MIETVSMWCSIFGLAVGIIGLILSIYFWCYTWKHVRTLRKLKKFNFSESYQIMDFINDIQQMLQEKPDMKNPFKLTSDSMLESSKAALFNFIQSQYKKELK